MAWIWKALSAALLYFLCARLSLLLSFEHTNASPVWPPSGLALALLFRWGLKVWPGLMLGSLLANVSVFYHNHVDANHLAIWTSSFVISLGNILEYLSAYALIKRFMGRDLLFKNAYDVLIFALITFGSCLIACTIGPWVICSMGLTPWSVYNTMWFTWWLGDASGLLVFAPLFIPGPMVPQLKMYRESTLFIIITIIISVCFFILPTQKGVNSPPYLIIPMLVWSSYRYGIKVTSSAIVIIALTIIFGGLYERGPFHGESQNETLLLIQRFLCMISIMSMALSAQVHAEQIAIGELKRSNEDLSLFAYVASHDLQEPLRKIQCYMGLLFDPKQNDSIEEKERYKFYIKDAVSRMKTLIQDLLSFAQVTTTKEAFTRTDLNLVLNKTLDIMKISLQENQAEVKATYLPIVKADFVQMGQLFQNLIENAVKYKSSRPPRIEISVEHQKKYCTISVSDNGIGFEMGYAEKIFEIFQRLHSRGEYSGTGIGLALCKKIVERHGGQIWAQSKIKEGSVFYFTLPYAED